MLAGVRTSHRARIPAAPKEARRDMRTPLIAGVLGIVVMVSACGGSSGSPASEQALERKADTYAISQIERYFHESMAKKDIDQMMSLWTSNATFTYGPGQTATGTDQIRKVWLGAPAWKPETHWLSDHPAYKLRVTVNGDRGTLHFECHFIDVDTGKVAAVTAGDLDVARIDGRWLITKMVGSTTELAI
jgi:ketosteroid isomerase-like protein